MNYREYSDGMTSAIENNDTKSFEMYLQQSEQMYITRMKYTERMLQDHLKDILVECCSLQRKELLDVFLKLYPSYQKQALLFWNSASHSISVDDIISDYPQIDIDAALGCAIKGRCLSNVKIIRPQSTGYCAPLHGLWLAIYAKDEDIFDYLMTDDWRPLVEEPDRFGTCLWGDLLSLAVQEGFVYAVAPLLKYADPTYKNSIALQFACSRENQSVVDLLYPLSDVDTALKDLEDKMLRRTPISPAYFFLLGLKAKKEHEWHDKKIDASED